MELKQVDKIISTLIGAIEMEKAQKWEEALLCWASLAGMATMFQLDDFYNYVREATQECLEKIKKGGKN